jgi:hypothetical protein
MKTVGEEINVSSPGATEKKKCRQEEHPEKWRDLW